MSAILNLLIMIPTALLFIYQIANDHFNLILLIIIIYSFINYKSITDKNKEIFIYRKAFYEFIKTSSRLVKYQKNDELKDYLKQCRNTPFYKQLKIDNSSNQNIEYIKQVYNIDDEE